ncbi:hypothetical protein [Bacillus chungangensis]|uniref:Phage protein n=1 Tax=Bacillus chungangensis TaxID=587633 RepID=A0ABT9WS07_9BACI|nr:hypothetical protein [Bacillus chungangensis]MDQ0176009.1 hypothetical protein [Bacillus chungangensis]
MNTSKKLEQSKKANRKQQERRREVLSESEIKDLMGMNMPIYRRRRGAFRQKN